MECASSLINETAQGKRERRKKPVRDHHEHCSRDSDQAQARDSQKGKAHMRDA